KSVIISSVVKPIIFVKIFKRTAHTVQLGIVFYSYVIMRISFRILFFDCGILAIIQMEFQLRNPLNDSFSVLLSPFLSRYPHIVSTVAVFGYVAVSGCSLWM